MARKCLALLCLGAVLLAGADAALAKAVKSQLDLGGGAGAKVILNFSEEDSQIIVNVNAWGLAPETTYTVEVRDGLGVVVASEQFTTKPDKAKDKKPDNGKGNDDKPKPRGKSKGHVNIHIPWDPLTPPPDLTTWTVSVAVPAPPPVGP
ncbi:MAG: hypothetical protein FJ290_28075 [Planctomycetes bacterium]|nr:hypothetical protein [Planctomycetota bacterium]